VVVVVLVEVILVLVVVAVVGVAVVVVVVVFVEVIVVVVVVVVRVVVIVVVVIVVVIVVVVIIVIILLIVIVAVVVYLLRNKPKKCSSQLLRGGSLKSTNVYGDTFVTFSALKSLIPLVTGVIRLQHCARRKCFLRTVIHYTPAVSHSVELGNKYVL
jgi:hypothetical protein